MRRFLVPILLVAVATVLGIVVSTSSSGPATTGAELTAQQTTLASSSNSEGETLFAQTCATCHGSNAAGSRLAPNLRGVGAATVDLWISSGWMPLRNPTSQPIKKPAYFDRQQTLAIANYIGSIAGGPGIPTVSTKHANLSQGFSLFALNCAPCHTITGAGDALSNGITAPPLHGLAPVEIAEAIRTGPGNMPRFSSNQISGAELSDVVGYVTKDIEHPDHPGGLSLGGVGPVAEGFIGLFVGVGACMLIALWIGDRTEREDDEEDAALAHGAEHG